MFIIVVRNYLKGIDYVKGDAHSLSIIPSQFRMPSKSPAYNVHNPSWSQNKKHFDNGFNSPLVTIASNQISTIGS